MPISMICIIDAQFEDDDVRYAGELVRYFLDLYTQPGDIVFDPFAGFGTTLYTAEAGTVSLMV